MVVVLSISVAVIRLNSFLISYESASLFNLTSSFRVKI